VPAAHAGGVVAESVPEHPSSLPLAVDLDGTLLRTDLLWEGLAGLLKRAVELRLQSDTEGHGHARVAGRGYQPEDRLVIGHLGTAAGSLGLLVLLAQPL